MTLARLAVLSSTLFVAFAAPAAPAQEPVDLGVVSRLREESFERSQVMDILWHLTDLHGPRLTNSPQQRAASAWARDWLEAQGFANVALEDWGEFGLGWSTERCQVEMTEPTPMSLIAYPKAWTKGLDEVVEGEVVLIEASTAEDLEQYRGQLAGRIVLVGGLATPESPFEALAKRHDDTTLAELVDQSPTNESGGGSDRAARRAEWRRMRKLRDARNELFAEEGVAVVLEPDGGRRNHYGVLMLGSGGSYDPEEERALPQVVVSGEQYNRLARLVQRGYPVSVRVDLANTFHDEDLVGRNVVAELPGGNLAHEVVMLGAHFDSWHPGTGATDNGASCAVMMEAMRLIKSLGETPRRTIRVALWTGEEQGLHGSKAYVANHFGDKSTHAWLPEREHLSAYFNMDNGAGSLRGVYMEGNAAVEPIFRAWLAPFADLGADTLTMQGTGGTDHLSFQAVGLPGFQFIQDPMDYGTRTHHTNMDLYERVLEEDVQQAAAIIASFAWHAANRSEKLPRVPLPPLPEPDPSAGSPSASAGGPSREAEGYDADDDYDHDRDHGH